MRIARIVPVVAAIGMALASTPVVADCQLSGPLEEELPRARVAFVGTVTDVNGTSATFAVSEVWRGDVGETARVAGAFDDGSFGEDDRAWEVGITYLVLPYVDGAALRDTICSATTAWTDDLATLRPTDARILTASESGTPGPMLLFAAVALVILAFTAIAWIAIRRPRS